MRHAYTSLGVGFLISAIYFCLGKLGLSLAFINPSASTIWPAAGFALASLLLIGIRYWPAIFVGAFLVNITTQGGFASTFGIATGNTLEAVAAAWLVTRFAKGTQAFDSLPTIFFYVLYAVLLSTVISATLGVTSLALGGFVPWDSFRLVWITWWIGDSSSNLMVAPLLILLKKHWRSFWNNRPLLERITLPLLAFSASQLIFTQPLSLSYLCILPVLWAAFRFGQVGALTVSFLISVVALWNTLQDRGPFSIIETSNSLLAVQFFISVLTLTALAVAAIVAEREKSQEDLRRKERLLTDFFENGAVALHWVGPDGIILRANKTELQMLGYAEEEYIGRHISEFHVDSPVIDCILQKLSCGETLNNFDAKLRCKDGSIKHVLISSNVLWEDGEFIHTRCFTRDITEQKRAEEALRTSRDQFWSIISHSPVGIYLVDSDLRIQMVNARAKPAFGEIHPLIGQDLSQVLGRLWSSEATSELLKAFKTTLDSGEPHLSRGFSAVRKDLGILQFYDWEIHRITLPNGQLGVVCYFIDISSHIQAQQALQDSAERLQLALSAGRLGDWSWEARSDVVTLGARASEIFGLKPGFSITWSSMRRILHEDDRLRAQKAVEESLSSKTDYDIQYRVQRSPTDFVWVAAKGRGIYSENGAVIGMIGVVQDVTEQKQAEEAIRLAGQRFRFLAESLPQKIFTATPSGRFNYFNQQWAEFSGLTVEEMQSRGWLHFVHDDEAEETQSAWRCSIAQGIPFQMEHRFRSWDGTYRWHLSRAHAMRDAKGQIIMWIGSNTDIDELRKVQIDLEVASRAKDQFLATLSHELRTPLTPVVMTISALRNQGGLSKPIATALERIDRNIQTEARLIDDLLDLTRITQNKLEFDFEVLDLHECLEQSIELCMPEIIKTDPRYSLNLAKGAPRIRGDRKRLQQVFWNLMKNAIKFSPDGGTLRITTEMVDDEVLIQFADQGIGIPSEYLEKIFNPFEQAENSGSGGLGLGLAICKRATEGMGGRICAESPGLGKGSVFTVCFPLVKSQCSINRAAPAAEDLASA